MDEALLGSVSFLCCWYLVRRWTYFWPTPQRLRWNECRGRVTPEQGSRKQKSREWAPWGQSYASTRWRRTDISRFLLLDPPALMKKALQLTHSRGTCPPPPPPAPLLSRLPPLPGPYLASERQAATAHLALSVSPVPLNNNLLRAPRTRRARRFRLPFWRLLMLQYGGGKTSARSDTLSYSGRSTWLQWVMRWYTNCHTYC